MTSAPAATAVPSPCINLCRIDEATGWCEGCLRSLAEIAAWSQLDDAGKRALWTCLPARREQLAAMGGAVAAPPRAG